MPDQFGNLNSLADFTTGRRIRFISYLGPDLALACKSTVAYIHHLSVNGDFTVFTITKTSEGFGLNNHADLGWWSNDDGRGHSGVYVGYPNHMVTQPYDYGFTVDFVNGVWFALNNHDHTRVVDVKESDTTEGNQVIGFEWNGGDNQIWRAQLV